MLAKSPSPPTMSDPRLSIILPTFNGERHLARLLPMLARQELAGGFEIRAIDSESSDATRDLLEGAGAAVMRIARAEFKHGTARNRCAAGARGELLVFLSQDVVPRDERFLEHLAAAFDDPRVAGAYARILPHADDDPLTARTVLEQPEASEEPLLRDLDGVGPVWDMKAEERAAHLHFNNIASCIRRSVFAKIPFPDVAFGEDFAWAARALTHGHRIRFVPESVVYHAHRYGLESAFERYRVDAAFHRLIHGYRVRPTLASVARGILYEMRQDVRYVLKNGGALHLLRSPGLRTAQVLGQYFGSRGWKLGSGTAATQRMR